MKSDEDVLFESQSNFDSKFLQPILKKEDTNIDIFLSAEG